MSRNSNHQEFGVNARESFSIRALSSECVVLTDTQNYQYDSQQDTTCTYTEPCSRIRERITSIPTSSET